MTGGERPARILYVQHRHEPSGASRALGLLIRELDRTRYEPHALCPPGPAARLLRDAGAHVHEGPVALFTHIWASTYHGLRWALAGRELARLPRAELALRRLFRGDGLALVHLNDSPLVHAAWAASRDGVPVVWHLRSALPASGGAARSRALRRAIARFATVAVAINDDVAASFGVGAEIVPDPVDLQRFRPGDAVSERNRLGLAPSPTVAFFGYLYPAKGFREFIEAAAVLRSRGVPARFVVVGGGVRGDAYFRSVQGRALSAIGARADHEREARALVATLGLGDAVELVPYVEDPAPYYRASDVVVAPSRGPEVGLPVLEAAASGVPAVATGSATGGGVLVPGETGLLAPAGDAEALADAVARLLRNGERRAALGRAARARAEERFGSTRHARALEALYERALEAEGARPAR